jgi:hypothetical protein
LERQDLTAETRRNPDIGKNQKTYRRFTRINADQEEQRAEPRRHGDTEEIGKNKTSPLINTDDTDSEKPKVGTTGTQRTQRKVGGGKAKPLKHIGTEEAEGIGRANVGGGKRVGRQMSSLHLKSRNMACYPMVLKDYGFPSYFARRFRYNGQALVYSELLACSSAFASESAAFGLKDRTQ